MNFINPKTFQLLGFDDKIVAFKLAADRLKLHYRKENEALSLG